MSQSLFSDASQRLDEALEYASISEDAIERLKLPKSSLKVSIPVRMDDGNGCAFFRATGCATTTPEAPPKAAFATTKTCPATRSNPWPFG